MKILVVLLTMSLATSAFAKNLNCKGDAIADGKDSVFTLTLNQKDGLIVGAAAKDGMSSSSVTVPANKVDHWVEGGHIPALGMASGLRIYLLSDTQATLQMSEGYGTGEANGVYVDMNCK